MFRVKHICDKECNKQKKKTEEKILMNKKQYDLKKIINKYF